MAASTWVKSELDRQGCCYEEIHHPETFTAQAGGQCDHRSGHRVAKTVIVIAAGRPVELVLPASRRVDLDWVRTLLRADEVRLATETELDEYFADCDRGAVPPLRHLKG